MPYLYGDIWVVEKDELVPKYWKNANALKCDVYKYKDKPYGLNKITGGGNGRKLRIDFYSLDKWIQEDIGDPKAHEHWLLRLYEKDEQSYNYYTSEFKYPDGSFLNPETQHQYITNARTIDAILKLRELRIQEISSKGHSTRGVMKSLHSDAMSFKPVQEKHYGISHNLPTHYKRFQQTIKKYEDMGHKSLIKDADGKTRGNAKKVKDTKQESILRQLLRKHNNFDNEQVKDLYNTVASPLGWKKIEAATVANYREKWELTTYSGRAGEIAFDNKKLMQHKRKPPTQPLYYWTADGWDVELLYQTQTVNSKGHKVTTYHNRVNVVVVLDAFNKYPVGYAIGDDETPALIRQAFRNAVKHTEELFGAKHKVHQIQTDRYAIKKLLPFYNRVSKKGTPTKARTSKSKIIEPWFNFLNKKYCQLMPNWSGFGVTSKKENQPNSEYLNKIRHSFPDKNGCIAQIEHILEMERESLREKYLEAYANMPQEDRIIINDETYLYQLGETTGYTNKLQGDGLNMTINRGKYTYDSFDINFRKNAHMDWAVKFDPEDVRKVIACNAKSKDGKLIEVIGTQRFVLEEKYIQPMALKDRVEGDDLQLNAVNQFNNQTKQMVIEESTQDAEVVNQLFKNNKLENTLTKLVLVDSNGQHKNQKSQARLNGAPKKLANKVQQQVEVEQEENWQQKRQQYLQSKVDVSKYLDQ